MAWVMSRTILHLDLDAFYPSVELLDDPRLAGTPVIVGGLGSRGVVASASYEARAFGVHSALPMAVARRRCPEGIYLQPRFERYRELSRQVFSIYRSWSELVEPLSLDEAYLDVSHHTASGLQIARRIKQQVRERTGLTVSAGVAHNKLLAKLASDMDKPDGLTWIREREAAAILAPLPVERLRGVGPSTAQRLRDAGYTSIGELATADSDALGRLLGKHGTRMVELARGEDQREVSPPGRPKSISAETTFDKDIYSWAEAAPHVRSFAERIAAGLERRDLFARTVTLKVRFRDFRTITRSYTAAEGVRSPEQLLAIARELARRVGLRRGQAMRLVGLGVHNIGSPEELQARPDLRAPQLRLFEHD